MLYIDKVEDNTSHIHYNDLHVYGHAYHQNPSPGVDDIYNFGRPFLGHHYYILSLSDLCLGVKKIFKGIMHIHYMTYMAAP